MKLRALQKKDAALMLEWMHDENVYSFLSKDFSHMTIEDCQKFISEAASLSGSSRHYAIADENDEYMGTISLKNIEWEEKRAEYAISCRTKAMGKGFAKAATEELFRIAFCELGLELLYLDVYDYNVRAQRLYQKVGFRQTEKPKFLEGEWDSRLLWFEKRPDERR